MIKQEVNELKRLYTPSNCSITRICGCYVDGEKNRKTEFKEAFLSLPEEEIFKYFELLRKTLSGTLGKNLLNLDFPLSSEEAGGTQEFLLKLRDSKLKDEELLSQFYDRIISSYEYVGNYLILIIHDAYDVPGKTTDGLTMEDASDSVFEYMLCCICPVNLSKPGLSYDAAANEFSIVLEIHRIDRFSAGRTTDLTDSVIHIFSLFFGRKQIHSGFISNRHIMEIPDKVRSKIDQAVVKCL